MFARLSTLSDSELKAIIDYVDIHDNEDLYLAAIEELRSRMY